MPGTSLRVNVLQQRSKEVGALGCSHGLKASSPCLPLQCLRCWLAGFNSKPTGPPSSDSEPACMRAAEFMHAERGVRPAVQHVGARGDRHLRHQPVAGRHGAVHWCAPACSCNCLHVALAYV